MTTPTPGDLNARQAELDARTIYDIACIREARPDASREDVEFKAIALRNFNAIAALSALPAGGEAVSAEALTDWVHEKLLGFSRKIYGEPWVKEDLRMAFKCLHPLYTTPPADTSFDPASIGPFTAAAALMQAADADVGAQGEGLRSALVRLLEAYDDNASEFEAAAAAQQARDALAAAPAAGKGVDAWMTDDGRVISARQKEVALRDGGASASSVAPYSIALTRQPVAGDGKDAARFAWWFTREDTSDELVELCLQSINPENNPSLDEWRAAIDTAMAAPTDPAQGDGPAAAASDGEG